MDLVIWLAFMAIVCIAFGLIYRNDFKDAAVVIIISEIITAGLLFYSEALWLPIILVSVCIVFIAIIKETDNAKTAVIVTFIAFLVTVVILVIFSQSNPASFVVDREISQSYDLVAVKQTVRTNGEVYFLSGSLEEGDYYEYRYRDGSGTRSGKISRYVPLIIEDETLKNTGNLYYYRSFRDYEENQGIWKLLFGSGGGKDYFTDQQIEIRVPNGTVDRTMGAM
jgi:hypothetical protein